MYTSNSPALQHTIDVPTIHATSLRNIHAPNVVCMPNRAARKVDRHAAR